MINFIKMFIDSFVGEDARMSYSQRTVKRKCKALSEKLKLNQNQKMDKNELIKLLLNNIQLFIDHKIHRDEVFENLYLPFVNDNHLEKNEIKDEDYRHKEFLNFCSEVQFSIHSTIIP